MTSCVIKVSIDCDVAIGSADDLTPDQIQWAKEWAAVELIRTAEPIQITPDAMSLSETEPMTATAAFLHNGMEVQ